MVHQGEVSGFSVPPDTLGSRYDGDIRTMRRPARVAVEQTIFIVSIFFGVFAVALIAYTLLAIVLGHIKV